MDAIYFISKLPGIDLKNRIANGDSIRKVMINGIIIFNENPEKLLTQIPAGVIERVQVFNDTLDAQGMGIKRSTQSKVINVKTTDDYFVNFKGKLFAGYALKDYFFGRRTHDETSR